MVDSAIDIERSTAPPPILAWLPTAQSTHQPLLHQLDRNRTSGSGTMDPLSPRASLGLELSPSPLEFDNLELEPTHTAPLLVYQNNGTVVYRLNDTGFKVILSPNLQENTIRLEHEKQISNFLPPSTCHKRQAVDVTSFNGLPALVFKWVNGLTVKEWLQKIQMEYIVVDMNARLGVAMAISKTLHEFHVEGVVHNNLTTENIILSFVEGGYVATFIGYSNAVMYRKDNSALDNVDEKKVKEFDLKSLGFVLNLIFLDEGCSQVQGAAGGLPINYGDESVISYEETIDHRTRKRGKQQVAVEGLPHYLGTLISTLLDSSSDNNMMCYESAKDVFLDLQFLSENSSGSMMARTLDEATINGNLRLSGEAFYGRQNQVSMLYHLIQTTAALGDRPLMATISGYAGTGKSSLVHQMKKPLQDVNGYFIEGKFNKLSRPDTILAYALNSFFGNLLDNDTTNDGTMKWRVASAIGTSSDNVLFEILPNLHKWMIIGDVVPESQFPSSAVKCRSSHRLKYMFCKLVSAIACRAHPLILYLDDIQWADEMTLDAIRMMMTDPDIRHFLFLGCYRDNEVNSSHLLISTINSIQERGIDIVNIKIGPIEKECVNTLLSDVLCLPHSLCRPLSDAVHSKTGGVILFILRFLASLNNDGDLWFSMTKRRWMYDLEQIRQKEIHNDVVTHMTEHMKSLSKKMRTGLKLAACLGTTFDDRVWEKVRRDNDIEDSFLQSCVDFGFLQVVGSDKYIWAHDQIQRAAYDLIPTNRREAFHLLIGSKLFMQSLPSEMEHMLFFIVDNMNRGSTLIEDPDQKWEVAQLNLDAGEKAMKETAFHSAAKYLLAGISFLGPDSWDVKYNLSLNLYDAASEALYVTGDFTLLTALSDDPLVKARSFEDKLNILNNLVRSLAASSKYEEGITKCLEILSLLGTVIPTEITGEVHIREVAEVKELLRGKSRQELLSLPMMLETQYLAAMQFMNHALTMTFIARPLLNPILVFRMVKMSMEHGMSNISAFAFACYGAYLVIDRDIEGGHLMGRVATEMTKRLDAVEMTPRIYATVYGFINIWKEPFQAGQNKHLEAFDSGCATGDMEYALTNLYLYINTGIYGCGDNLKNSCQNARSFAKRAFQCNHRTVGISLAVLQQLTLDLMGVTENALLHFANKMTEDSCFAKCRENNEISMCRLICTKKKYLAFFTGDLDTAAKFYDLHQAHFSGGSTGRLVSVIVSAFIDGLIGFFLARKHREDEAKWTTVGLDSIESLKTWVQSSSWNFSNKLYLLEAEYCFLKNDDEGAVAFYTASIKAAHEHRFIHEEGLAEEKLATYLLHKGGHDDAMHHLVNAKRCYDVWGAHALVKRVQKAIAILMPLCKKNTFT